MKKIAVFAGTTEGRKLAEFLEDFPVQVLIHTATEYGKTSLGTYQNAEVLCGRMDQKQMEEFLEKYKINLVVDATHPFAEIVTENIREACKNCQVEYIRCLREASVIGKEDAVSVEHNVVLVDSVREAVEYLQQTRGNILIATGSKELKEYTKIPDFQDRCYARVLSTEQAVSESRSLGFEGKHLIAMQGPFSEEMNLALLHHVDAEYFVTKESGKTGGFPEKLKAASQAGTVLVVIGRPVETGWKLQEVMEYLRVWNCR